jgi:hypothetical protein
MSKRLGVAIVAALLCSSAYADFNALVRAMHAQRGLHRVWTPGLGFARLVVWMIHPVGVRDFQIAVFEGKARFDSRDFERILGASDGTPMVQVHSNRTGEVAVIWARPVSGDLMEMLLVAHDPNDETVVLRTVVDGETLAREISNPRDASRVARR